MPLSSSRLRINVFAIVMWAVTLALVVTGFVVRQIGITAYASTYANASTATDELAYYTSIISAQYTADLGNSLLAAGGVALVIALAAHAITFWSRARSVTTSPVEPSAQEPVEAEHVVDAAVAADEPAVDIEATAPDSASAEGPAVSEPEETSEPEKQPVA